MGKYNQTEAKTGYSYLGNESSPRYSHNDRKEGQSCECGKPRLYWSGNSRKNGKPYKAWFCSTKVCQPIWIK